MQKRKVGTKEWSDVSYNIGNGCVHDCRYCYARGMALMGGRVSSAAVWHEEHLKPRPTKLPSNQKVMFPSTHDISPFYLEDAVIAIRALLDRGNDLVIVSKPHLVCVERLCREFQDDKAKLLFRFTIGSLNESLARLWEPGAPAMAERLQCLKHAFEAGFRTSVSMEPLLAGRKDAVKTFTAVSTFVTEKVWIGKMNHVARRVKKSEPAIRLACTDILDQQSDSEMLALVDTLSDEPKVAWKDSIREVVSLHAGTRTKSDRKP